MAHMLKNFALAACLLSTGFVMAACGDEENNEADNPEIYQNVIEPLYKVLGAKASCTNFLQDSTNFVKEKKTSIDEACSSYKNSLQSKANNKPSALAEKLDNSGYYLAAYILADKLHDAATGCTVDSITAEQAKNAFESIFNSPGCEDFLKDADSISKSRGQRK